MRILTISNLYPPERFGGWELGCKQMVDELRRRGHDVRVLTSTPRVFEDGAVNGDVVRLMRLEESWDPALIGTDTPLRRSRRVLVEPHNIEILHQQLDTFEPDVVYVWNLLGLGALALLLALRMRRLPWVVHLMDAMPLNLASVAFGAHVRFADMLFPVLEGTWISCSQSLLDENAAANAVLRGNVVTVSNWISGPRPAMRTHWYEPGSTLRCAYSGQIFTPKGIGIMLESVGTLVAEGLPIEVDLYGDGLERFQYESMALQLGLSDVVRFHGQVGQDALMSALAAHDVFLFPTEMREPFGFAPLEAAAAGCVPLVTGGAGVTEWLVSGVHLLTVRRDAAHLTDALRRIIDGTLPLEPVGRRGQRVVLDDFHIEVVADKVEALLQAEAERPRDAAEMSWRDIGRWARLTELLADSLLAGD
ncbi:MAG: glycosyltransferase family 4 protein [Candidatus Dormibacteraeota bacterium]|nr:glycosyltransferase family 4 protein [Candidatus Dormibacteraeota bacterium]